MIAQLTDLDTDKLIVNGLGDIFIREGENQIFSLNLTIEGNNTKASAEDRSYCGVFGWLPLKDVIEASKIAGVYALYTSTTVIPRSLWDDLPQLKSQTAPYLKNPYLKGEVCVINEPVREMARKILVKAFNHFEKNNRKANYQQLK